MVAVSEAFCYSVNGDSCLEDFKVVARPGMRAIRKRREVKRGHIRAISVLSRHMVNRPADVSHGLLVFWPRPVVRKQKARSQFAPGGLILQQVFTLGGNQE